MKSEGLQPVRLNDTLSIKAYRMLEEMILTLNIEPGSILTEKDLIGATGFGRTPLREALLALERDGMVKMLPRKGIIVSEIHIGEYLAMLEMRRVLDRLIVGKAAKRATLREKEQFKLIASEMDKEAARDHLREFMRLDTEFDDLLWHASHNPFAVRAVKPAHAHCRRFWYLYKHNGDLAKSAGLHSKLLKAIASGNETKATNASDAFMNYLEEFARKTIEL